MYMKTTVVLLLCWLTTSVSEAQEVNLTGTWSMFEISYQTDKGTQKTTEEQLKAKGSVTDFHFMDKGNFRQTSKLSGSGAMDTYNGTWKIAGNKLIVTLNLGEQKVDQDYTYKLEENRLTLTRTNHDGTIKIISSYMAKKQN